MGSASRGDHADVVLQSLPEAVGVLAPGTTRAWEFISVNEAMRELLGLQGGLGAPTDEAGPAGPELDADSRRSIRSALARGERATLVVQATRRDGTAFWAQVDLVPLDGAVGERPLWSVLARDISDQIEWAYVERVQREMERRASLGLTIVARVSDLLQESESSEVLRAIADMLGRKAVAWAGFVIEDRHLREVAGIDQMPRRPPAPRPPGHDPVSQLLGGVTMYTVTLDPDAPATPGSATAEILAIVEPHLARHADSAREVLVLPVLGRARTLGLLVALPYTPEARGVVDAPDRRDTREELVTLLELVTRRAGMAMENARLYAAEHQLAEALQRAMLPEQDEIPGLDVWTYYAPSFAHAQVGGDWYDVVNLRDGTVAVVIGDVVGHDVEAAATMGQLRSVVRAFAVELVDPGAVLHRVDDLVNTMHMPRSASLVYATLAPRDVGWALTYSRAGHLPPLLVRGSGVTVLDGGAGTLMGYGDGPRATATAELLPGDVLVLYTDGLIERRDRAMRDGLDALVELCTSRYPPDAAGMGEELLAALADAPEDDVALVVIRVPGPLDGPTGSVTQRRRWQLPREPTSIGRARHAVRNTARAWGIEDPGPAELVVSELMSNAVMHGHGRIGLQLHDTGDGLRIEVFDSNPAPPIAREANPGRVGGFGMHIVDRLAHWGWRPTSSGKVVWARLRAAHLDGSADGSPAGAE